MRADDLQQLNKLLELAANMQITVNISFKDDGWCDINTSSLAPSEEFSCKTHSNGIAFDDAIERLNNITGGETT